jgi:hypothetical protein
MANGPTHISLGPRPGYEPAKNPRAEGPTYTSYQPRPKA